MKVMILDAYAHRECMDQFVSTVSYLLFFLSCEVI